EAEQVATTVKQAHSVFKSIDVVDGNETWDYEYSASAKNKKTGGKKALLPGEGNVGTFGELSGSVGDDLTPHHMPQDKLMKAHGVARDDGIAMTMDQPRGAGGRHRRTRTYGRSPDLSAEPSEELEADIADARQIYRDDGLLTSKIQSALQKVRNLNY